MKFFQQIKDDIKKLKREVGLIQVAPEEREAWLPWVYRPSTLFDNFEALRMQVNELTKKFNVLLQHFGIEYVEITEKNGGIKVVQKYRKVKKVKKSKKSEEDEYED